MKKCCMIVSDLFEEVEAVGTYGILVRGGLAVDVFALSGTRAKGRFGMTISGLRPLSELQQNYDALILPGGPEYRAVEADARVQKLIAEYFAANKTVAAICASPTVLGRAGFLKGKNYTCFTSMDEDFGGHYLDDYVVRDGNLITGKSAAATIDFGFAVIDALLGSAQKQKTQAEIYYKG